MIEFLQRRKEMKNSSFTRVWATHKGSSTLTLGHSALWSLRTLLLLLLYGERGKMSVSAFHIHSPPERNSYANSLLGWGAPEQVFNKGDSRTANHGPAHPLGGSQASKAQSRQGPCDYVMKPMRLFLPVPLPLLSLSPLSPSLYENWMGNMGKMVIKWEQKLKRCIQRAQTM